MAMSFIERIQSAWNAFRSRDPTIPVDAGPGYYYRPDRPRLSRGNERTIVTSLYNRIAIDVSNVDLRHCVTDDEGRYLDDVDSGLNRCLTLEANIDQTHREFMRDATLSLIDEGVIAIVPVDTENNPILFESFDVLSMRVGKIVEWRPRQVKIRLYNDKTGEKEEIWMPKKSVAIIENPFYPIMNEPSSIMQRLIQKLRLLDAIDEQSGSGKLDLIIQLPYVIKTTTRRNQAEARRKDIEMQLASSKYGIAYTDGTEKITQLNRPVENNLLKQIEYFTNMLYGQIGMHQTILDGTADEQTMVNYNNRIVRTLVSAIVDGMKRTFLSEEARKDKKETIMFFIDPFKLVSPDKMADIADKFTRNEILSKNEVREIVGRKPSKDPKADQLINSNISQPTEVLKDIQKDGSVEEKIQGESQNGEV